MYIRKNIIYYTSKIKNYPEVNYRLKIKRQQNRMIFFFSYTKGTRKQTGLLPKQQPLNLSQEQSQELGNEFKLSLSLFLSALIDYKTWHIELKAQRTGQSLSYTHTHTNKKYMFIFLFFLYSNTIISDVTTHKATVNCDPRDYICIRLSRENG